MMASTTVDKEDVVKTFNHRRRTIPELLAARELGARASKNNRVTPLELSSAIAWNTGRMQNMILAVGPGTPAAMIAALQNEDTSSSSSSASTHGEEEEEEEAREEEKDNEDTDEEMDDVDVVVGRNDITVRRSRRHSEDDDELLDTIPGGGLDMDDPSSLERAERVLLRLMQEEDEESDEESQHETTANGNVAPSIRHGGCINTATWLTSPWRLSLPNCTSSITAVDSQECPTQLITSGDDRVVKFWDVRNAMGSTSPLPDGGYVECPFADMSEGSPYDWRRHAGNGLPLAGSVIPLASLPTDHRGNVFHVAPLDFHPGKVVTCGADGYVRMVDVHSEGSSTVLVSPEYSDDEMLPAGLRSMRSHMCFSHHFLNANTGLLCSERGLTRFDVRLPPREQSTRSLLGNDKSVKSCAIWSASSEPMIDVDSAYVFAGGSSADVALYDLRMTDGSSSRVVQKYRPSGLSATSQVSVSGLDVSKDRRELLVSYENDQIFTFPVFPHSRSAAGPTVDELEEYCTNYSKDEGEEPALRELAAYGGHLNRFTFLKNAKYAGPNDEYICTGSDSGRAWIYERATGTVAAFLSADQSTCNGVVPHPSLPFFVTYGIDSTAKLWRATIPVDRDADDSPLGRARRYHRQEYEKSMLVRNWNYVKTTAASISSLEDGVAAEEAVTIFPDQFPVTDETMSNSILGGILLRRRMFGLRGQRASNIGNDLRDLPNTLQQNILSCVLAADDGEPEPVWSGLKDLCRRISTIRLRHQADQRGLEWNAKVPWMLAPRKRYLGMQLAEDSSASTAEGTCYGDPVDLIPESPASWIPYDPDMSPHPQACGPRFNTDDYADFYIEQYSQFCSGGETDELSKSTESPLGRAKREGQDDDTEMSTSTSGAVASEGEVKSEQSDDIAQYDSECAWKLLLDTALALKEGGNAALQAGSSVEAARRYDHAIKYCAVAVLAHPNANQDFLERADHKWCPIRKVLVTTRLNLCMVLSNCDLRAAREQAVLALRELAPFCTEKGKVVVSKKLGVNRYKDEPVSSYQETKELQAKAFFRLGSVEFKVGDYEEAVSNFEESIKSTEATSKVPDRVVLRRLVEAKREKARKSKRQKKKFKRMLAQEAALGETGN